MNILSNLTTKQAITTTTISAYTLAVNSFLNNFIDFCTTFIVPIICAYGVVANILNYLVFSNRELKDITFKYYLINAVSNSIYLLICFFLFVARCGVYCSFASTYSAQFYLLYIYTYFKGIFAILTICNQIIVSIYRLLIVINKPTQLFNNYKIIVFVLLIFSAIFYSPLLFTKFINESITNVTTVINGTIKSKITQRYSNVNNFIGNSDVGKWLIIFVITIMRGFFSLAVILMLGIVTLIKLNQHIKNVEKLRGKRVKTKNGNIFIRQENSTTDYFSMINNKTHFTKIYDKSNETLAEEKTERLKRIHELRSRRLTLMVASIGILFSIGKN